MRSVVVKCYLINRNVNIIEGRFKLFFKKLKRIPAMFLVCALLFTTVFSYSMIANASSSFTPRLDAPSYSNDYYYSNKNIYYQYGYGMPNCTAYAYGRAYEILGRDPGLCHYDAYEWYDYNDGYSRGQTPKVGAVACWEYYRNGETGGHVAVVEKVENGTVTFSNSAWGWENFYLTYADVNDPAMGESGWNFQGFIYLGDFGKNNNNNDDNGNDTITYKTGVYEVEVSDYLNMRESATTSSKTVYQIKNGTELYVTDVKQSGGYTWGYTTYKNVKGWVALDYCKYLRDKPLDNGNNYEHGDINMNGAVDILDITELQMYVSKNADFTDTQLKLADVDGNGKIDISDVTELQRIISLNKA